MAIAKTGNDWIVTPTTASNDDVTYTFKVTVSDLCGKYDSMSTSFILHVGCPAAASSDTYTFVDTSPRTATLTVGDSKTAIASVTYSSLSQVLPFTCSIQPAYKGIVYSNYIDNTFGGQTAPSLSQTSASFTCQSSGCGTLDISSTQYPMSLSY